MSFHHKFLWSMGGSSEQPPVAVLDEKMTHDSSESRTASVLLRSREAELKGCLDLFFRPMYDNRVARVLILLMCCPSVLMSGCADDGFSLSCRQPAVEQTVHSSILIPNPYPIEITGSAYRWRVRYPGCDGQLDTPDDLHGERDVHVPVDTDIVFELRSADYVYLFSIPELKLKEIAVPSLEFRLSFRASATSELTLDGDEFCGDPHTELKGRVIVDSHDQFQQWLTRLNR